MRSWNSKVAVRRIGIAFCGPLALAAGFMPALARASPTPIYECNGCTDGGMGNVARSVVARKFPTPQPGNGAYATVYNLENNRIATFFVGWYQASEGTGGEPGRYQWYVTAAATPAALKDAFSKLRSIYVGNGGSLILAYNQGALGGSSSAETQLASTTSDDGDGCWEVEGTDNAYDAAVSSAVRNYYRDRIENSIKNQSIYGVYLWDVLQVARLIKSPFLNSFDVPVVFDQHFVDRGSIAYRFNWDTNRVEHVAKTIEDCEKNDVPENKQDFNGRQFRFDNEYNLNNFVGYVGGWGGTVSFSGSGAGGWICTGGVDRNGRVYATCMKQK
jgi:hypothetical protein